MNGTEREARIKNVTHNGMIAPAEIEFYLSDHLGNTRVVYEPTYASGGLELAINYAADYFPYGKVLREYVNTATGDPEKFLTTQHERDKETGLDYRGARFYDSDIGRFLSLDPHAADYPGVSPYNYVFNNPVHFIDPDGKDGTPYSEAYMNGLNDAIVSNTVYLGFGRDLAADMYPNDLYAQKAFLEGQIVGDFVSLVMGGFTVDAGLMQLGGAGLLAVNVEGAVITVPAATVMTIAAGVSIGIGAYTVYNAQSGLKSSYAQLQMVHKKIDAQEAKSSGGDYKGTKHTDNRHVDRSKYPEKSKYSKPNQKTKLETRTINNPDSKKTQNNGRVVYEKEYGRKIGTKGETSHKVVTDPKKKKIITSYPQK